MATGIATCPTCGEKFRVDAAMVGQNVPCPKCGESIYMEGVDGAGPNAHGNTQSNTGHFQIPVDVPEEDLSGLACPAGAAGSGNGRRPSRYRFGRIFIVLSRVVAVLVLLLGAAFAFMRYLAFQSEIEQLRNRDLQSYEDREKLTKSQDELLKSYDNTVAILSRSASDGRVLFKLRDSVTRTDFYFNENPESKEELEENLAQLAVVEGKVIEIQGVFDATLKAYFPNMPATSRSRSNKPFNPLGTRSNTLSYRIGGSSHSFYEKSTEDRKKSAITNRIESLQNATFPSSMKSDELLPFLEDLIERLFPSDKSVLVQGKERGNMISESKPKSHVETEEMRVAEFFARLAEILGKDWVVDKHLKDVKDTIDEAIRNLEKYEKHVEQEMKRLIVEEVVIVVLTLLSALLVFVIADILAAHFDIADVVCATDIESVIRAKVVK